MNASEFTGSGLINLVKPIILRDDEYVTHAQVTAVDAQAYTWAEGNLIGSRILSLFGLQLDSHQHVHKLVSCPGQLVTRLV